MARAVRFDLIADSSKFTRGMKNAQRSTEGFQKHTSQAGSALKGLFAAFSVGVVVTGLKSTVDAASNLNETVSKTKVVFGPAAKSVEDFSKRAATSIGLSRQEAQEAAATFGNLFVSMKIGAPKAADMSTKMVQLAGDLASFNNASPTETLEALRSGLVGETEPLRRFGINLNDADLRQKALALGLVKTTKDVLPPAVKAQAAYALILEQSKTAQGDFARTSGGLANQQRILAAKIKDLKATIGQALLPAVLAGVSAFNSFLGAVDRNKTAFGILFGVLGAGGAVIGGLVLIGKTHKAVTEGVAAATETWKTVQKGLNTVLGISKVQAAGSAAATEGLAVAENTAAASSTRLAGALKAVQLAVPILAAAWAGYVDAQKTWNERGNTSDSLLTKIRKGIESSIPPIAALDSSYGKHTKTTRQAADATHQSALETAYAAQQTQAQRLEMVKALPQFQTSADKIALNAEKAKDLSAKLKDLKQQFKDQVGAVRDSILAYDGLISKSKVTASEVIKDLHNQVANLKTYSADARRLIKAGVDPSAIEELRQKGLDAVHGLATGTKSQLADYKKTWHDRQKETKGDFLSSMQEQYEGLVRKMRAMQREINKLKGKTVDVTASTKVDPNVLKVFTAAGGRVRMMARGGRITAGSGPTADDVLIRASKGETVVSAGDSSRPDFREWAKRRGIPGFARGGAVYAAELGMRNRASGLMVASTVRAAKLYQQMAGMDIPGGGGAGAALAKQVAAWTIAALHRSLGEAAGWFRRLMFESGGNPRAINRCVTLDTMILTRRGWLKHDEVQVGDETIGYNLATGRSEWTRINDVLHYADAPLMRIGNKRWSVECTPNHRWIDEPKVTSYGELPDGCWLCPWPTGVRRRGHTTDGGMAIHLAKAHGLKRIPLDFLRMRNSRMVEAQDLSFTGHSNIRVAADAETGAGLPVSTDEAEFLGWLLGDGHVDRRTQQVSRGRSYNRAIRVTLAQAKPRFVPVCRDLVARIDPAAREYVQQLPSGLSSSTWYLSIDAGISLLERSGYAEPEMMVLRMSAGQREAFLRGVIGAEGHADDVGPGQGSRGGRRVVIPQKYGAKHDAIKLAVFLCGFRPSVSDRTAYNAQHGWAPAGVINTCKPFITPLFREDAGRAEVWCVTTDLGTWTAQQNGQIFLTGNSDSNWLAGHPSVGIAQVIRRTFAANAGRYRGVGPFAYGVSMNPYANSYAGGHYAVGRYGSLAAVDPRVRPIGYDAGGWLPPGLSVAYNGTGRTEPVGFDYDRLAAALVRALQAAPRPTVAVSDIHQGLLARKRGLSTNLGLS